MNARLLLPFALLLCGCPKKTPAPVAEAGKTGAEVKTTTPSKTTAPAKQKKKKKARKPKPIPIMTRAEWVANAVKYLAFPRPNRTNMILFFSARGTETDLELKLDGRKLELDGEALPANGWKELERRLALARERYRGAGAHGPAIDVWVEPGTPAAVSTRALEIVAASYPDEAYAAPKCPAVTYATLMPKPRPRYVPPRRTPVVVKRPIRVPTIKTKPTYPVKTRAAWMAEAKAFVEQSADQRIAVLLFCPSLTAKTKTPRIDMNVLRLKLLNRGGKPVVQCRGRDLNAPGDLTADNVDGHTVWAALDKEIDERKSSYKGSSHHGLPIRLDIDAGLPTAVALRALQAAGRIYGDGHYKRPELPPLQRAVLKRKR